MLFYKAFFWWGLGESFNKSHHKLLEDRSFCEIPPFDGYLKFDKHNYLLTSLDLHKMLGKRKNTW